MKFGKNPYGRSFWIGESELILDIIATLQRMIDKSDVDVRLYYEQSYSFPRKFYALPIPFDDSKVRTSIDELQSISDNLHNKVSKVVMMQIVNKLYWFTEASKNGMVQVGISYVLVENCDGKGNPGILIFWKK